MKKVWGRILGLGFVALVLLLALQVIPLLRGPAFLVTNGTGADVAVTAQWRNRSRPLGDLAAGEQIRFRLNDEAAMHFVARYPDGRELASEEIYFTGGSRVEAEVREHRILVRYDFER